MQIDPYEHDPGRWGASLVNNAELLISCLEAAAPRSVVEVGAFAGDVTRLLLDWAACSGARVTAIDPHPRTSLELLEQERPELELIRAPSLDALRKVSAPEAVIVDGDHNYYTVREELRLIDARAAGAVPPLVLLHDVCWPHARRDSYYAPELIPEEHRQPMVKDAGLFPGEPGVRHGALPFPWAAQREGGARNGVLTAVEDHVAEREGLRSAVVPAFFGFGVVWHRDAPWASAVAELVEAWDRNPLLDRLEANRIFHLACRHVQMTEAAEQAAVIARQQAVLRRLLESSAFSLAERLSRLRLKVGIGSKHSALSKDDVRRALAD